MAEEENPKRELTEQEILAEQEAAKTILFKKVFSGPDGEQVLQILCTEHHVLDGTYSEDPNKMYFREGERSVVKSILARIELDELAALKRLRKMIDNSLNQDDE